jgi:hypothetical protein
MEKHTDSFVAAIRAYYKALIHRTKFQIVAEMLE